jgi:hypothetical protein
MRVRTSGGGMRTSGMRGCQHPWGDAAAAGPVAADGEMAETRRAPIPVHVAHTFGQSQPTLRWVNGSQVSDLYVAGMDTERSWPPPACELDMHKGGFVLSKRISRLMRPHFVSGFFKRARWLSATWSRPLMRPKCGTGRA